MGHEVHVLTGFPNYPYGKLYDGYRVRPVRHEVEGGIHVIRTALYPSHDASTVKRATNYLSFAITSTCIGVPNLPHLDALWVFNSPVTVAMPMLTLKHLRRTPTLLHIMDLWPDSLLSTGFSNLLTNRLPFGAVSRIVDRMYSSADAIGCISPSMNALLARRGVPSTKLHYLPLWADETVYEPQEDNGELRAQLGFSGNQVVLMYAGAMGKAQDVVRLVEAFQQLPPESQLRLVLVGSGTLQAEIHQATLQSSGRIVLRHGLSTLEMQAYMAMSDIHFVGFADLKF